MGSKTAFLTILHVCTHTNDARTHTHMHATHKHTHRGNSGKLVWPSRLGEGTYSLSWWEDEPAYEIWVASSDAHHSVVTVIEYGGKFNNVEVRGKYACSLTD